VTIWHPFGDDGAKRIGREMGADPLAGTAWFSPSTVTEGGVPANEEPLTVRLAMGQPAGTVDTDTVIEVTVIWTL
jgi:hypothetical protein